MDVGVTGDRQSVRPARDVIREKTGPDTPDRVIHVAHIFGCQDGPEGRYCPTHSPEDLGDEPMRYFTLPTREPS